MPQHRVLWLASVFIAGMLLTGLPGWLPPHDGGGLRDPLMIAGLAGLSALAMMLVVSGIVSPLWGCAALAPCLPLTVGVRLAFEWPLSSASPDLWTLEIGVALLAGIVALLPGICAGLLVRLMQDSRRG